MVEDLNDSCSTNTDNWNFNEMINKPGIDPFNNKNN